MSDFCIKIAAATDDLFDDLNPRPQPSVLMAEYNDGIDQRAYLYSAADTSAWPGGITVLGEWDQATGAPQITIQDDYWTYCATLGNDSGKATGERDTIRWQGRPEEKFFSYDDTDPQNILAERYPDTDRPFTLKIQREDHTSDPTFPGWGWSVEMLSSDPLRDITARAVGIYSDPDCTAFLYTTGAFIQDGSHSNNFYTECPPGQRTASPDQVNFALLLGAAQEGYFNLPEGSDTTQALFWAKDAGASPEWQAGISYAVDDEVTYQGSSYRCLQAHTSQVGWEPPNVPALWQAI